MSSREGTASSRLIHDFGLSNRSPREFLRSLDALDSFDRPLPQSHAIRQAWRNLGLNGVLYANNQPIAYFKETGHQLAAEELTDLQNRFWNHALCPVLVVASRSSVEVFSSRVAPPGPGEDPRSTERLVTALDRTAETLSQLHALTARIETGRIFERTESFRPEQAVDEHLLRNIKATRNRLLATGGTLDLPTVHALLGRIIFASYLAQRKIINGPFFESVGAEGIADIVQLLAELPADKARHSLYRLFKKLQGPFKSNLFSDTLDAEEANVTEEHIPVLRRFLEGHDVATGQQRFFSTYDFSVIPVELISAIYEDFIQAEGEEHQRKTGAFYTPPQLAELLVEVATEGCTELLGKRFLDPACGSGAFLVAAFNRMAEEWRGKHPTAKNATRARALCDILRENLVGVDVNEAACRITCFSLYLALLDHLEPRDIQELAAKGTLLPDLLLLPEKSQPRGKPARTIICRDFFGDDLPVGEEFDFVIGNPPWVSRGRVKSEHSAIAWCERENLPIPQKQIAHAFMWKAPRHAGEDGRICLLLPSIVFLGQTDGFQKEWLQQFAVERVIQLADMRFILFATAIRPAVMVLYRSTPPIAEEITHESPTTEYAELRGGIVTIWPEDRTTIRLRDVLEAAERAEAGAVWKTALWATPRDSKLIARLLSLPRLSDIAGKPREGKRLIVGQGFKPLSASNAPTGLPSRQAWWSPERLFLKARSGHFYYDIVLTRNDCEEIGHRFQELHRLPDQRLFRSPLIVCNQGFSRVAFSDFDVIFQHAIQSIKGEKSDSELLAFLTAALLSPLAKYIQFHTAANWGTERDKVLLFELLRMPFPLPDDAPDPKAARDAVHQAAAEIQRLAQVLSQPLADIDGERRYTRHRLVDLVYRYFDLNEEEQVLVADTDRYIIPSATPQRGTTDLPILVQSRPADRLRYARRLCRVLNRWGSRSSWKLTARTVVAPDADTAVISLEKGVTSEKPTETVAPEELEAALDRVRAVLPRKQGGIAYMRNLKVFDASTIHIVKPLALGHWLETTALNDADEIAAAVLSGGRHGDSR